MHKKNKNIIKNVSKYDKKNYINTKNEKIYIQPNIVIVCVPDLYIGQCVYRVWESILEGRVFNVDLLLIIGTSLGSASFSMVWWNIMTWLFSPQILTKGTPYWWLALENHGVSLVS